MLCVFYAADDSEEPELVNCNVGSYWTS